MNEMQVLDIILQEFRAMNLPAPFGRPLRTHTREGLVWARIARRIISDSESEKRAAARHASYVGAMITRGKTRF